MSSWMRVVAVSLPTAAGSTTVTGLPGTPKLIKLIAVAPTTTQARPSFSVGFCDGALNQGCGCTRYTLGSGVADTGQYWLNNAIGVLWNTTNARPITVSAMTGDGFTLTTGNALTNITTVYCMVWGGSTVSGHVHTAANTAGTYNCTDTAFTPTLGFAMGSGVGGGITFGTINSVGTIGLMVWDGTTKRSHWVNSDHAVATTRTRSGARTGNMFASSVIAAGASNVVSDPALSFSSFNANGFTWVQANASTQLTVFAVLGGIVAKVTTTTVPAATGVVTVSGLGLNPNNAIAIISATDAGDDGTLSNEANFGIGFATSTGGGVTLAGAIIDADALATNTEAQANKTTTNFITSQKRTGTNTWATRAEAAVSAWGAGSLSLNWGTADAVAGQVTIVAFNDSPVSAGAALKRRSKSMQSIVKNATDARLRTVYFELFAADGVTPYAGSLTGVKAKWRPNGTGAEVSSTADVAMVDSETSQAYVILTQAESNTFAIGDRVSAYVPLAAGTRNSDNQLLMVLESDITAAPPAIVDANIEQINNVPLVGNGSSTKFNV